MAYPHSPSQISTDEYITSLANKFMNTKPEEFTTSILLTSLGIDSLPAVTVQSKLFDDLKVQIPLIKLLDPGVALQT